MDLQLSVFLLFILFTAGHSLQCYVCSSLTGSCAGETFITCPDGSSQCTSTILGVQVGGISSTGSTKGCAATACVPQSYNVGIIRSTTSCCTADKCNLADAEPVATGKSCYYCDSKTCSNTVKCSGIEDRCINGTGNLAFGLSTVVKGCVSKSICDAASASGVKTLTCCEGDLCNGAQSVTQSVLFLCCSLLSYFMMH